MSSYDVIVVGGGGSGLAAAVSAAQHGGRVLVLEKQPHLGGTTGIAVGSFTAAATRLQQAKRVTDSVADHAIDAGKFAAAEIEARNNAELRQFFLSHAAETLDWLAALGLAFVGPSPEPPNRVPRMHNVIPNARAYIAALQIELIRRGGTILTSAAVTELVRESGRVVGVRVKTHGQPGVARKFCASRGVILAAGDYAGAPDLIRRFKGAGFDAIEAINPCAGGDGQRLVEAAGGQLLNMDVTYGPELRCVAATPPRSQSWLPTSGWAARVVAAGAPAYFPLGPCGPTSNGCWSPGNIPRTPFLTTARFWSTAGASGSSTSAAGPTASWRSLDSRTRSPTFCSTAG